MGVGTEPQSINTRYNSDKYTGEGRMERLHKYFPKYLILPQSQDKVRLFQQPQTYLLHTQGECVNYIFCATAMSQSLLVIYNFSPSFSFCTSRSFSYFSRLTVFAG